MASGESQDWSIGRSGCLRRSCLVFRLYFSKATLKMEEKLECEVDVEGTADIV